MKGHGETTEEQLKARELCERTGVPLWGAYRVVRGEITLAQLLKSMMRRERFQRLQKAGFDADLAGHVASGSLSKWRAALLQEMRGAGRGKFTRDRIAIAGREKLALSIWRFGQSSWDSGLITRQRTYDFVMTPKTGEPVEVLKHDVKMVCHPTDLDAVRESCAIEKSVRKMGLTSSKDRKDRYRPTDEQLTQARESGRLVRWTFRDGWSVRGRIYAFGRWDIDIMVEQGAAATLFFHALHANTDRDLG